MAVLARTRDNLGGERFVEVGDGVRLWVEESGAADGSALLLVMGANASGLAWPDELVATLGARQRVVRYDHRDTRRSTWAFDRRPYAVADLVRDAIAVLDGLGIERAHVAGVSMGGTLVQLLLIDFRVEHWRLLNGEELPFDADEFLQLEERLITHAGRHDNPAAHARADQDGQARAPSWRRSLSPRS